MKQFLPQNISIKPFLPRNPVQRDFLVCLIIWFVLEVVCFAIATAIKIPPETLSQKLFVLSIPIGIGGALLMACSTQIALSLARHQPRQKRLKGLAAQALSWLGLVGIGFPLLILIFRVALQMMAPLRT